MNVRVIGVDCATDDKKVGLALADYQAGRMSIREAMLCGRGESPASIIAGWLRRAAAPSLLAIDAPLGWPEPLSRALVDHQAGDSLGASPNQMFRRATDRFIQEKLGKTPLDVGADRIARTAHAALQLLGDLRAGLRLSIPLAWSPSLSGVSAIEVYPAATLIAHGFRSDGYKKPEAKDERKQILVSVKDLVDLGEHGELLENNADALDAIVCVLSAFDFLEGCAMLPPNPTLAKREGWIWSASKRADQAVTSARRRRPIGA